MPMDDGMAARAIDEPEEFDIEAAQDELQISAGERAQLEKKARRLAAKEARDAPGLCWSSAAREKTVAFLRHGMKTRAGEKG